MKIQEVLDLLSLQELPSPSQTAKGKCAALVQRVTGQKDYVITKNGGVIIDIRYRCSIVRILEYYPIIKEKPTPSEPASVTEEKFNRFKAINFLEKQNLNKSSLFKKTDKQLQELMDGFR